MPEPIDNLPACMLCGDKGIQYIPDYPPPYRFCGCDAGAHRILSDPNVVARSNAAYDKVHGGKG